MSVVHAILDCFTDANGALSHAVHQNPEVLFIVAADVPQNILDSVEVGFIFFETAPFHDSLKEAKGVEEEVGIEDLFCNELIDDEVFDVLQESFEKVLVDVKEEGRGRTPQQFVEVGQKGQGYLDAFLAILAYLESLQNLRKGVDDVLDVDSVVTLVLEKLHMDSGHISQQTSHLNLQLHRLHFLEEETVQSDPLAVPQPFVELRLRRLPSSLRRNHQTPHLPHLPELVVLLPQPVETETGPHQLKSSSYCVFRSYKLEGFFDWSLLESDVFCQESLFEAEVGESEHAADVLVGEVPFEMAARSWSAPVIFHSVDDFCEEMKGQFNSEGRTVDEIGDLGQQVLKTFLTEKVLDGQTNSVEKKSCFHLNLLTVFMVSPDVSEESSAEEIFDSFGGGLVDWSQS